MDKINENIKKEINKIIDSGLIIEDEMVKLYSDAILNNETFSSLESSQADNIKINLNILKTDTLKHIEMLNKIKNNIK